jgi:thioredoxin-related protein
MKHILLLLIAISAMTPAMKGEDKKKKEKVKMKMEPKATDSTEVNWMSLDDVQAAMRKQPKKVWLDMYTDWCGWCKVMDKKTFSNKDVIKYLNKNFYSVKFNAESKDSVRFMGKMYGFSPEQRSHALAVELMQGRMSYPTGIFMEENFQNPQLIPGFQDVKAMEIILKYLGENIYKQKSFEDWQKEFSPSWTASPAQESVAPPGH